MSNQPSSPGYGLEDLLYLMRRLRDPLHGCPWDVKQNYRSIAPSTLEEAYEVVDAIEREDYQHLKDELGDLLFQVIFYAQLAQEEGRFDFYNIVSGLTEKLVRRHPHVFPDGNLREYINATTIDQDQIKRQWEAIKLEERKAKGEQSLLADVPSGLPALSRAQKLQKRAATVSFDFAHVGAALQKLREELAELELAISQHASGEIEEEMGDVFFSLVNVSRHLNLDGEKSLRRANEKFIARFTCIEKHLLEQGLHWQDQSAEQLDKLWELAKNSTKPTSLTNNIAQADRE